jgi:PAS domain S-box-containing protein
MREASERGLTIGSEVAWLAELGIAAVGTDLEGTICDWNRAAAQLYGRESQEMLGSPLTAIRLAEGDESTAASMVWGLRRAGHWQGRLEIEDATGSPVCLDVRARRVLDGASRPVGFTAAFLDLGGQLRAERRTAESEAQLRLAHHAAGLAGEFWQATLDSLTAHVAVLDEHGDIVAVNASWRRFAEREGGRTDYVGSNYIAACSASEDPLAEAVAASLAEMLAGERERFELEYPGDSPTAQRWFLLRATLYEGSGPRRVVVAHENITERREAQELVAMQTGLLDEIDASVIVIDSERRVLSWSAGAEHLYGWTREEAIGRHVRDLIRAADPGPGTQELGVFRSGDRWDNEYLVRRKDGTTFSAYVRNRVIYDQEGRQKALVGVSMDISGRKESERALLRARNYLRAVTDSMGEGMYTLDPDGCVEYMNQVAQDLLGWSLEELRGRAMYPIIASPAANGSSRPMQESPTLRARRDGEVVRVADDNFIRRDGTELPVAYTAAPFATDDGVEGCVVVFEDITKRKTEARRVESDLEKLTWFGRVQKALADDRFELHAQPIIELATGRVVQRELLLRMRHPDSGVSELIAPGCFLPAAEEFGLIGEIDRWVIDRSAEVAATGRGVELNVSARSISDPSLVDYIKGAVERTGAAPESIVFEITETAVISDRLAAGAFVERLHRLGFKIALDDFGTGFGGFSYLKQLPIDYLKIDTEFVGDLRSSAASRHVVEAIVKLAEGFRLSTVGEGVEDGETLELLRELGVDYAQGFHIGRPSPL